MKSAEHTVYIFGYGSLINKESRAVTGITGHAVPVRVHRLKRGWIYDVDKLHHPQSRNTPYTAVGAQIDSNNFGSTVNGVIFPLDYNEIAKYDQREARYKRYKVDNNDIEILGDNTFFNANSIVYVYIVPNNIALSLDNVKKRILKQSYIDIFLSGCFDFDFAFALECVETTDFWNGKYENDRDQSIFSKQKISKDSKQKIDQLMDTYLPSLKQG